MLALHLAKTQPCELAVCSVALGSASVDSAYEIVIAAMRRALAHGVACACEIVRGDSVALELIRLASRIDADCIVAGANGQTRLNAEPYGSVAEDLMENAPCAVLTIRAAKEHHVSQTQTTLVASFQS
jgi:nucleotide-binding universal stress UspA family protein